MQTRDQANGSKTWKIVASVAAASALGLSGIALANDDGRSSAPEPITLDDTTKVTQVSTPTTVPTTVQEAVRMGADTASVASPLDDEVEDQASVASQASPNTPASPASPNTPASPASPNTPASPASPNTPASPASPVSQPTPDSPASPQESPASPVSQDSPASADSGD
ncbi:MAG TPA: hypothetical protein VHL52_04780 [Acidimicrobiia bacterium]|nr:hypothetical protein [Acidimicrobiia bacterium]